MWFNQNLGPETVEREYKLGVINFEREISYQEALSLIESGKWIFNTEIISLISSYLKKYLSKYISSFTHTLSNIKNAELYIGVNDDGIVKGIPFKGNLNLDFCKKAISDIFEKQLIFPDDDSKKFLRNNLLIESIKVEYNGDHCSSEYFKNNIKKYFSRDKDLKRYQRFKELWCNLMSKQGGKINENLNNNRQVFLKYIDDNDIITKSKYQHTYSHLEYLIDVPTYYDMKATLRTKQFNELKRGNVVKYKEIINHKRVDLYLHEYNDVFCLYLYGRFHDFQRDSYRNFKPVRPKIKPDVNYPKFLLSQVEHMIPLWKKNNRNMNLYVIKITIPSGFLRQTESIKYYNERKRKYEECFRANDFAGPATLTLDNGV